MNKKGVIPVRNKGVISAKAEGLAVRQTGIQDQRKHLAVSFPSPLSRGQASRESSPSGNSCFRKAFTIIELLISIAITALIGSAIYFMLSSALESWEYARDQLALQKVLSETIDEVLSGSAASYGLRDSLEILTAEKTKVEFVPPWTDDTHTVAGEDFIYTLNRKRKPGTAIPIGEMKLPETDKYKIIPLREIEGEDREVSQVRLGLIAPRGSLLKFTYHPDPAANSDSIKTIWWDADNKQVYLENDGNIENLSRNPFDVQITNMEMRYYDNANNLVTKFARVDKRDLDMITGVEIFMEARLGQYKQSLISFVNLRNAPMRSGYLLLKKDMRFPIPDSKTIHTLLIGNICGVSSGDQLQVEAKPEQGKVWRLTIDFSRLKTADPKIESYTIEYPPGHPVYTEYPRRSIDVGMDLLSLGSGGLYDYDDDDDVDDSVLLEGDVMFRVTKMDIEGAGIFVKP
jgi:prepilin-type N-terminal cleavage/methylation domain-containing protein